MFLLRNQSYLGQPCQERQTNAPFLDQNQIAQPPTAPFHPQKTYLPDVEI